MASPELWLPSPAEVAPGPPLQWSSSSAYNLFIQVPVGTHHLQHHCCICSILACLIQKWQVTSSKEQVTSDWTTGNGLQLCQGRFWLDTRKIFSKGWKGLEDCQGQWWNHHAWNWHLRTEFNGEHGSDVRLIVELNDLKGLFQPQWSSDPKKFKVGRVG